MTIVDILLYIYIYIRIYVLQSFYRSKENETKCVSNKLYINSENTLQHTVYINIINDLIIANK